MSTPTRQNTVFRALVWSKSLFTILNLGQDRIWTLIEDELKVGCGKIDLQSHILSGWDDLTCAFSPRNI